MAVGRAELVFLPSAGEIFQVLVTITRLVLSPWMLPYAVSSVMLQLPLFPLLGFLLFSSWARSVLVGTSISASSLFFMVGSRRGTEQLTFLFDTLAANLSIDERYKALIVVCLPEFLALRYRLVSAVHSDIVIKVYIIIVQQESEVHSLVTILSSSIYILSLRYGK